MCGLVGFTLPRNGDNAVLEDMLSSISYRGPDQSNILIDKDFAVGHKRLIIFLRMGGCSRVMIHVKRNLLHIMESYMGIAY